MILTLQASRASHVEVQHHEVGTAGQAEIDIRFDTLLRQADQLMLYKYVVKNVAWAARQDGDVHAQARVPGQRLGHARAPVAVEGRRAAVLRRERLRRPVRHGALVHRRTARPRPAGAGLRRADDQLLQAAGARLRGAGEPGLLSQRNRSASVRIPLYSQSPKAKRIEFRCPDPSCNPYLAFSAMLMAGLDGIQNRIEPPDPVDKDLYDLPPEELAEVPQVPGSLEEALDALEADHDFLQAGGVFTDDLIDTWISYKREHEVDAIRLRPHPWEFHLYYDI